MSTTSGSLPSSAASEDSVMSLGSDDGNFDNIHVVVRVRPLTRQEEGRKDIQAVRFPAEGQIALDDHSVGQPRVFTFHVVFEPEATQEEVFDHCGIKRLIDMALDGFACTVLAYGQTGAGKTYTLTGPQSDDLLRPGVRPSPGVVHMAFAYLFNQIKQRKDIEYIVQASYMEIYKEQVLDLLNPSTKPLAVRWSKEKGFYAENLFSVECEDAGDLEGVLDEGRKNRQVRAHNMNEHSSRSHTILILTLTSEVRDSEDPTHYIRRYGKLFLVDLAGSEKTKKTNSRGETLKEANNINKSLLVLGNCISALADPRKRSSHIPYRDSTLTKLLADSLGGSGLALMIACVSPSRVNIAETLNTLRYASRAKRIKTKPMVRMDPREQLIISLKREVRVLRMENSFLRQQLHLDNGLLTNNKGAAAVRGNVLVDDMKPDELKTMLQQYMNDNESLREENAELRFTNDLLTRELERVNKENERLQKERTRSAKQTRRPDSITASRAVLGSSDSLIDSNTWNNGAWRSIIDADGEIEYMNNLNNNLTNNGRNLLNRQQQQLTPAKRKVGKSLGDITENQDENEEKQPVGLRRQRRNSWGSGIPRPVDNSRSSKSPPQHTPTDADAEEMFEDRITPESNPTTPGSKLPPLLSMLMPKSRDRKKSGNKSKLKDPIDGETSTLARDLEQVQKAIRGESRASMRPTR
ncbi:kinesin-like protein KIF12 isoform X2 [Argiope bruennichi]|uniref:kinesin-like protein KIF12 isoform X2 n=1 Tax=Argiope bruennichi TaxID=94029 RepID=UPI0024950C65|nr:kinesin-like protein KIF12 isoform X2 [Argiope bruennichi]